MPANFASALAIELRRGDGGDARDYLRFKFKNGTADGDFQTVHAFDHKGDIPLAEFIYRSQVCTSSSLPLGCDAHTDWRVQNYAIKNNKEWASACGKNSYSIAGASAGTVNAACGGVLALVVLLGLFIVARFRKTRRAGAIRLAEGRALEVKA